MTGKTRPPPKRKRRTKTPDEKLDELEKAKARLQLRINAEKSKLSKQERKEDTREKIIIGSIVLAAMEADQTFADLIAVKMKKYCATAREKERAEKDHEFLRYRALKRKQEAEAKA